MPAPTPLQPKRRLLPHFVALASIVTVYFAMSYLTGQPSLSFAIAGITSLILFIVVRIVQLRGRVTLALTVFGFPLLIALGFACFTALDPFFRLQRHADMLRDAGLGFRGRAPDEVGEWKRTRDGIMLPIWLANRIGSDCMTKTHTIGGDIEQLQSIPFHEINTSSLRTLDLKRYGQEPAISPDLVDWINELNDPRIQLSVHHYRDIDGVALSRLRQRYSLELQIDDQVGDLSQLGNVGWMWISGDWLTNEQAKQIAKLGNTSLGLDLLQLDSNALKHLQNERSSLAIVRTKLDADAWNDLANLPQFVIELRGVDLRDLPTTINSFPPTDPPRRLHLHPNGISFNASDVERLVRFFDRKVLFVAGNLTDEQIKSLWEIPKLKEIRYQDANGVYVYAERPR